MLIWVVAGSIAFFGVKGGLFTLQSGGAYRVWGPEGSFIEDNNGLALAIVMTIPLLYFLYLQATKRWLRLGLLAAMVLGHRSALDRKINAAFVRAGCAHFLAVSGVHVVIVIFVASMFCRLLFLSRGQRLLALMLVVVAYAMLAEPRPSILRAAVIAEIYFVACLLYRERARLNWICATVGEAVMMAPVSKDHNSVSSCTLSRLICVSRSL